MHRTMTYAIRAGIFACLFPYTVAPVWAQDPTGASSLESQIAQILSQQPSTDLPGKVPAEEITKQREHWVDFAQRHPSLFVMIWNKNPRVRSLFGGQFPRGSARRAALAPATRAGRSNAGADEQEPSESGGNLSRHASRHVAKHQDDDASADDGEDRAEEGQGRSRADDDSVGDAHSMGRGRADDADDFSPASPGLGRGNGGFGGGLGGGRGFGGGGGHGRGR